jgi:hypothetical protein
MAAVEVRENEILIYIEQVHRDCDLVLDGTLSPDELAHKLVETVRSIEPRSA